MARILIVEDERPIRLLLEKSLSLVGHQCILAEDGLEALELLYEEKVDLIILDLMLPRLDGMSFMQKKEADIPVIMITAKVNLGDKIAGLEIGADDYITKPFEILEVIARVDALLRRTGKKSEIFTVDETVIELDRRIAKVEGVEVEMTPQEFALLEVLITNQNIALSREKLLTLAWGYDYIGESRTVDVHIQKLRKKLKLTDCIKTVYKMGYRFEV